MHVEEDSEFGQAMRRSYDWCVNRFGMQDHIPLHRRNGTYEFDYYMYEKPLPNVITNEPNATDVAVVKRKVETPSGVESGRSPGTGATGFRWQGNP